MREPSLNTQKLPSEEAVQPPTPILVSCVQNAKDTATQHHDPKEIIASIRADQSFDLRVPVEKIRRTFDSVMASSNDDRKAAKQAVDGNKKRLPGVMWSGTFSRRKQDALLQHSGLLCADLDGLGERMVDVRTNLANGPHLWALFTSPSFLPLIPLTSPKKSHLLGVSALY